MSTITPDQVAAHAGVQLYNAESSHSAGYRVTFQLLDVEEIDSFSGITKKRKNKAGGRYTMALVDAKERTPPHLCEVHFLGWSITHTSGAKVRFDLSGPEDFAFFRELPANSPDAAEWTLVLAELTDDDEVVDQAKLERAETVKGGALCKSAAILCGTADFQRWVALQDKLDRPRADPDICADFIRRRCRIKSRAQLDHDDAAAERFRRWVKVPFALWAEGR